MRRPTAKNWTAIHVRRGDFQFTEAKVDANAVLKAVDSVAQDSLIYVATDERKRDFFSPLAQKYTLVFLDDLAARRVPNSRQLCSRTRTGPAWSSSSSVGRLLYS